MVYSSLIQDVVAAKMTIQRVKIRFGLLSYNSNRHTLYGQKYMDKQSVWTLEHYSHV